MTYALHIFVGAQSAVLETIDNPDGLNGDYELIVNKRLCIGTGGGILDEHKDPHRDICSADLLVDLVGIKDPVFLELVNLTRYADRHAGVGMFSLPSLIKGWYRLMSEKQVFKQMAVRWYTDWLRYHSGYRAARPSNISLLDMAESMRIRHKEQMHKQFVRKVYNYLVRSHHKPSEDPLDLTNIIRYLAAMTEYENRETVHQIARGFVDQSVKLQLMFQDCFDNFRGEFTDILMPQTENVYHRLAVVSDDHEDAAKVARRRGAEIIISHQPSTGHVQILQSFRNNSWGDHRPIFCFEELVAELRKKELQKQGIQFLSKSPEYWRQWGKIPEVPEWYYHGNAEALYNGTNQSATGVVPTRLTSPEILRAIKRFLMYNYRFNDRVDYVIEHDQGVDPAVEDSTLEAEVKMSDVDGVHEAAMAAEQQAQSEEPSSAETIH